MGGGGQGGLFGSVVNEEHWHLQKNNPIELSSQRSASEVRVHCSPSLPPSPSRAQFLTESISAADGEG